MRLLALLAFLGALIPGTMTAQASATCADFDAWIWAQSVMEEYPSSASNLDPDGDGIACPSLTIHGFAPVLWTDEIPSSAVPAQVVGIVDGDTFDVTVNGFADRVRLYHINAPETSSDPHCGGDEATEFLQLILRWAPNNTVYLEYDQTERDRNDNRMAYAWYEIGSDVYMVNEAMVRSGYAESRTYQPDDKYREELNMAERFSVEKVTGVRLLCGRFRQPLSTVANDQQVRRAMRSQPNQGQFDSYLNGPNGPGGAQTLPAVVPTSPPQQVPPTPEPQQPVQSNCDPNYSGCVPNVPYDLDCADIGFRVQVLGYDRHGFDGDDDGWGCERY